MIFKYKSIDQGGAGKDGVIEAVNQDIAISSLQRRGLTIISIIEEKESVGFFNQDITLFEKVSFKDVVVLSRQISTLFEAQVSVLKTFRMLAEESDNKMLRDRLTKVADDIQGGLAISAAMAKHQDVFSDFYVNMVKSGEETGKLSETFLFLADYLDRSYELNAKTKNALIYPIFVILTFVVVMILMLTMVIPKLASILTESGQEVPVYTKAVIGLSNFLINYGLFFLIVIGLYGIYFWKFKYQKLGKGVFDRMKLGTPVVRDLYQKLYLSRFADNMDTMLSSGISMVRAIEISSTVVGSKVYEDILIDASKSIKAGISLSDALYKYHEIPNMMIQMIKVGEETGRLTFILKTVAKFYKREVDSAIDTLIGMIEPVMIVALGLGVGVLLASVLVPIYNVASTGF